MGKVTLQDVAKAAGVSTATVSWAVNDKRDVRIPEATRKKVRKVAEKLGYHPNALAKGLAQGSSSLIGFISDDVATSPFAGQVIRGAQDEAWRHNKILLIVDTGGKESIERSAFDFMMEHQVEGIIYSSWIHQEITPLKGFSPDNTVLVNCFDKAHDFRAVVPDERQGGREATELLLKAGHRRIAYLKHPNSKPDSVGRLAGYRDALQAAGIDFDPSLVISAYADQEGGYGAADALLATHATAAFCHNDRLAMGLYDALHERGLHVPDDISLVGFDNQEVISAHLHPALTTVGLPQYDLGKLGVRMLLERDDGVSGGEEDAGVAGTNDAARPDVRQSDGVGGPERPARSCKAILKVACPAVIRDSIAQNRR
ncbi:LacI family DNA-binding transcriptional regulator [Bifidobacterium sp. ESL0745]|uniref:LacI family DNA-binding transcriptional regulator n=1 Tax=Bifidobacterium sp. ESL0745 TaxID=2983226 RepID=UPI0023F7E519|nr:LacI family DNA-binding transcriptional regulator [Bifidobacterium sp. ESL0745]MDF7665868.1 LacI family DNA-binding transcriptional regulator [Bifidobacterium sp. ESL0745]